MSTSVSTRKPNGSKSAPARSIRCSDDTWERAKRRASFENVTISHVAAVLVEGYAKGLIDLPRTVYVPTRQPDGADQG